MIKGKLKTKIFLLMVAFASFIHADVFVTAQGRNQKINLDAKAKEKIIIYHFKNRKEYRCMMSGKIQIDSVTSNLQTHHTMIVTQPGSQILVIESLSDQSMIYQIWVQISNDLSKKQQIQITCDEREIRVKTSSASPSSKAKVTFSDMPSGLLEEVTMDTSMNHNLREKDIQTKLARFKTRTRVIASGKVEDKRDVHSRLLLTEALKKELDEFIKEEKHNRIVTDEARRLKDQLVSYKSELLQLSSKLSNGINLDALVSDDSNVTMANEAGKTTLEIKVNSFDHKAYGLIIDTRNEFERADTKDAYYQTLLRSKIAELKALLEEAVSIQDEVDLVRDLGLSMRIGTLIFDLDSEVKKYEKLLEGLSFESSNSPMVERRSERANIDAAVLKPFVTAEFSIPRVFNRENVVILLHSTLLLFDQIQIKKGEGRSQAVLLMQQANNLIATIERNDQALKDKEIKKLYSKLKKIATRFSKELK